MKFEDDWCKLVAIIVACLTILILGYMCSVHKITWKYIEAGYTRKTLIGSSDTHWVKE